jgi:hypothetical protein
MRTQGDPRFVMERFMIAKPADADGALSLQALA